MKRVLFGIVGGLVSLAAAGNPATGDGYLGYGMEERLPAFAEAQIARMTFPLAYDPSGETPFSVWREQARAKLIECLLEPPPEASFDAVVVDRKDRGTYEARKIVFNVSGFCRIPAYLLVPKGTGPFPAMIALHDHGARFSIGKEKVVRPFGVSHEVKRDAQEWVDACYGGRWIGDALAARGYVVFAADALFWGERGRREGVAYEEQQTLAANLLQVGMTWSGVITWDDVRCAEFVATLPEVEPARIGAVGLSMGCHRTWMLSAATDRIAAGAAICWMGTTEALMAPGNNQTKGQSAFSMLVPNLRNYLDYPDVAAIACPKPTLYYNGEQDPLFPVPGVEAAYARIRRVYESQGAGDRLVTKLWPVPHVFNLEMQEETFTWLDRQLTP
ncbi:MAG TPA: alpha/beta hydrolase family protein [Candidatus Hydrogenedentes bacterium]|nr:alpha/beta hydrolase family protein [Candidatus Hydrogenedentota bacterium]